MEDRGRIRSGMTFFGDSVMDASLRSKLRQARVGLLGAGLKRAFRDPGRFRGKIAGIVLGILGLIAFIGFLDFNFYLSAQLPSSDGAPKVWTKAPDFTLPDQSGNPVTLSGILKSQSEGFAPERGTYVLLVFYRGYW